MMQLDQSWNAAPAVVAMGDPKASVSLGRCILTPATKVTNTEAPDYYGIIVRKLAAAGVPQAYTAKGLKASFWTNIDTFLPPTGRLVLVHDDDGTLFGCGTLKQMHADAGEVDPYFVYMKLELN